MTLGTFGAIRDPAPTDAPRYMVAARGLEPRVYTPLTVVRNQGNLGACVPHAFGVAIETLAGGAIVSPLAMYLSMRIESGFPREQDSGCFLEPAARAVSKVGAGGDELWPYDVSKFTLDPPAEYVRQALDHRVTNWQRCTTVAQCRSALSAGLPIVTAFDVPASFREVGDTGIWKDRGGKAIGAHSVAVIGYDDATEMLLMQNSWGTGWGRAHPQHPDASKGYFSVPYATFEGSRFWDSVAVATMDTEAGA